MDSRSPHTPAQRASPSTHERRAPHAPLVKRFRVEQEHINPDPRKARKALLSQFDEEARLAALDAELRAEAEEFHAEQDGTEQQVPDRDTNVTNLCDLTNGGFDL